MSEPRTSRRGFLKLSGIAALAIGGSGLMSACSRADTGESSGGVTTLKFWDQPWGEAEYVAAATALVTETYQNPKFHWTYQQVQWNNFYQTYSAAVASKTNPAASTGGGFQAYGLADLGGIHYADKVVEKFKADGTYDDFIPGIIDAMSDGKGLTGIPWAVDVATLYYSKPLLEAAGLKEPKSWDDLYNNGLELKKQGIAGLIAGSGSGNHNGHQTILSFMINNGGGIFNEGQELDLLYDRNVEAVDFVIKLVNEGITPAGCETFNEDSMNGVWKAKKGAAGFRPPNYAIRLGPEGTILVNSPLTGPNGDKGSLRFINSVMMYSNNPSIEGTEDFVAWYTTHNDEFFLKSLASGLPVRKAILADPKMKANTEQQKVYDEWLPVAGFTGSRSKTAFADLALIDGAQPFFEFSQAVLQGKTPAKDCLSKFQDQLASIINK
jgi:multiple sugar transport system substrate-binding protein